MPRQDIACREGLVRFGTERSWLRFEEPVETFTAWTLEEVMPTIEAVEAAQRAGKWAVGMLSYDAGPAFDDAIVAQHDPSVPLVAFGIFDDASPSKGPAHAPFAVSDWTPEIDQEQYFSDIDRIRDLIGEGDTYQVNHTLRLHSRFWGSAEGLFASLTQAQDADHVAFLHLGGSALCSASPEMFFEVEDGRIVSKPMKGTRPRHPDTQRDEALADELLSSDKDRAENIMIVDMVRSDLGRIAVPGSVEVSSLLDLERYPTVQTLTSTIVAETEATFAEVLAAMYPVASITGTPKYRTTEIIDEVEHSPRGAYTGSVVTLAPDGRIEATVVIRSVWLDLTKGSASYGVGGGIVWDSDASDEWAETRHKSRVLDWATKPLELLETMAWNPEQGVVLGERHLKRLSTAARHFGIPLNLATVRNLLTNVMSDTPVKLRLLVDLSGTPRLEVLELPQVALRPIRVALDSEPVDPFDEFLRFKTTSRRRYEDALARVTNCADVLLWNPNGHVTETCIGNVVVDIDGRMLTPPLDDGLLDGTLRAELIEAGRIEEHPVPLSVLSRAKSIWRINSVRGWEELKIIT